MPRLSLDEYFVQMLDLIKQRGTCRRRQVGAIITDQRGHVLSTGYNGVPSGVRHCIDYPCLGAGDLPGDTRRCMAIHAEQNALLQCQALNRAHTMYTHTMPCFTCAKLIANTPICRIVYLNTYTDELGLKLLKDLNYEVIWYGHVGEESAR